MIRKISLLVALLVYVSSSVLGQDTIRYSYFVAGHVYGAAGDTIDGIYPDFVDEFESLNANPKIELGILTGDIVGPGPDTTEWDSTDQDLLLLNAEHRFVVGNHDMEDQALFESRYGPVYSSFVKNNDLFLLLDSQTDGWNIKGAQLAFVENELNDKADTVNNVFVFFHHLMFRTNSNRFNVITPNSGRGILYPQNFWTEFEPLFAALDNKVFMYAGDLGAGYWSSDFCYDQYDNITIMGSGMGEGPGDNYIIADVYESGAVDLHLICMEDGNENCFGDIEDYNLITEIDEVVVSSFKVYPNPVVDLLTIETELGDMKQVKIYNQLGGLVQQFEPGNLSELKISFSNYKSGMYVVQIYDQDKNVSQKLIIKQ